MRTWFISDTHFGHDNIIAYCDRPFWRFGAAPFELKPGRVPGPVAAHELRSGKVPCSKLMEDIIVANWNAVVAPEDFVYHLGDFAHWRMPAHEVQRVRDRLNGTIHLVLGNHDVDRWDNPLTAVKLAFAQRGTLSQQIALSAENVFLRHRGASAKYPRPCGDDVLFLHGHSHQKAGWRTGPNSVDLSIEGWGYKPVSLDEIRASIASLADTQPF